MRMVLKLLLIHRQLLLIHRQLLLIHRQLLLIRVSQGQPLKVSHKGYPQRGSQLFQAD